MRRYSLVVACVLLTASLPAFATIFGSVRGVVHDPEHRPIRGAHLTLKAQHSDFTQSQESNKNGEFLFTSVPIGDYTVTAWYKGFQKASEQVIVESDTSPVLHLQLAIEGAKELVTVYETPGQVTTDSATPTTMLSRKTIERTPGANLTNDMEMITDYVPATYVTHDMLHMLGGHQFEWLIDGVPIPNTNIATNLGPQIYPRDIDYLEVFSGSFDADYGDRTYGMFNVEPRTGFEYDRACDLDITAGSFYQTDNQLSCGSHTERWAYYVSLNGNRSGYGLQTPIAADVNDAANGFGGFGTFIFNANAQNQFRMIGSLMRDYYQIPIDPNPNSSGNQILESSGESPSYGLHDAEVEPDGYALLSWVHTFSPRTILTISPFYHYNGADYRGGVHDTPVRSTIQQNASYAGAQADLSKTLWRNQLQTGFYSFYQHQYSYFDNVFAVPTASTPNLPASSIGVNGGLAEEFVNDTFKATRWFTLILGLRSSQFDSTISEHANDPRFGAALQLPHLKWVLSGFYGYYYQAPPLSTATGALSGLATSQDFGFAPLHGERDIQWQYGLTIPYRNWTLTANNYETRAENWLDHNNIGESNIFWPITWSYALIQGWQLSLRSPNVLHHGQFHLAYANQIARATSPITGGLICPASAGTACPLDIPVGLAPVDHDQRNTLNVGFNGILPWNAYVSTNVYYGSGFTNGLYGSPEAQYPGPYLPSHTTFDLSAGKSFGKRYSVSATMLNVTDLRVQLDNSLTFGGFHWNEPRQIYGEFRYKFKF